MHEDILAGGALDEPVSLRPVEPLHSPLLSHKVLLSPLPNELFLRRFFVCPVPCALTFTAHATAQPLERTQELLYCRRCGGAASLQQKRLPHISSTVARDEIPRSRVNEGAISDCRHRNVNPVTASPTVSGERSTR